MVQAKIRPLDNLKRTHFGNGYVSPAILVKLGPTKREIIYFRETTVLKRNMELSRYSSEIEKYFSK